MPLTNKQKISETISNEEPMKEKRKLGLLPRVVIAIVLGIVIGQFAPSWLTRAFITFNGVFSQFLGFLIPLIIVGLVTPAIADVGRGAGRLLLATVVVAYADTVFAGMLAYGTGSLLFPAMIADTASLAAVEQPVALTAFFTVKIPPLLDVMSALVLSFVVGLGIATLGLGTLRHVAEEFKQLVSATIRVALIPLLPLYIFGIFLEMTVSGQAYRMLAVFAQIIVVIFVLHLFVLLYEYLIAGTIAKKNPLKCLWTMLPAYLTALGTSSSAATIPVTLEQTRKMGVSEGIAGFIVPLCATIHMAGSSLKICSCALAICLITGTPHSAGLFLHFTLMLAICAVAAPGVPGGVIMASLGPLASILGFGAEEQALMIALYIAMDSFGTACNVTGDGAIALAMDRFFGHPKAAETAHEAKNVAKD